MKWPAIIVSVIVLTDQLTKILAVHFLVEAESVSVLGELVKFSLIYNEGGAMGTSIGPSAYYLIIALVILPLLLFYIYSVRNQPSIATPLSFIAGGAIGNVIDRVRLGKVIDFIDVDFVDITLGNYHLDRWWTFNIADASITCAILFILLTMFRSERHQAENGVASTSSTISGADS